MTDLDGLLYSSQIGIAPIEVEGGVSGKVVDYLTHGLVAVVTPEAASGIVWCESLVVTGINSFAEKVREMVDHEPPPEMGINRPLDPTVAEHYFSDPGISTLAKRIGLRVSKHERLERPLLSLAFPGLNSGYMGRTAPHWLTTVATGDSETETCGGGHSSPSAATWTTE